VSVSILFCVCVCVCACVRNELFRVFINMPRGYPCRNITICLLHGPVNRVLRKQQNEEAEFLLTFIELYRQSVFSQDARAWMFTFLSRWLTDNGGWVDTLDTSFV
jgi:hypothetical protein